MQNYGSRKRTNRMIAIFIVMTAYSLLLGILKGMILDQLLCLLVVLLVFFPVLAFLLEQQRLDGRLCRNRMTDYGRVLSGVLLASFLGLICGFLPAFLKPILAICLVLSGFCSEWLGFCLSMYYIVILTITCGLSVNELLCYVLLALIANMLFVAWENPNLKKQFVLILCCIQSSIPTLFYYLEHRVAVLHMLLFSLMSGVLLAATLYFIYDKMCYAREHEVENQLLDMLEKEYSVLKELQSFSMKEYRHAVLVSKVASECAKIAGADKCLCAVAGLYYRIGIIKGENIAENGVVIAYEKCFPEKICQIMKEYHGILELPSTPESAIVQMIDGVLCRFEEMRVNDEMHEWNKDMVVYHVLTEFNSKGMYKKANLSMHNFLEIREYLVKEDTLL